MQLSGRFCQAAAARPAPAATTRSAASASRSDSARGAPAAIAESVDGEQHQHDDGEESGERVCDPGDEERRDRYDDGQRLRESEDPERLVKWLPRRASADGRIERHGRERKAMTVQRVTPDESATTTPSTRAMPAARRHRRRRRCGRFSAFALIFASVESMAATLGGVTAIRLPAAARRLPPRRSGVGVAAAATAFRDPARSACWTSVGFGSSRRCNPGWRRTRCSTVWPLPSAAAAARVSPPPPSFAYDRRVRHGSMACISLLSRASRASPSRAAESAARARRRRAAARARMRSA